MPLNKAPSFGTIVEYNSPYYRFTAKIDKEVKISGYFHGIIIKDIQGTWYAKDVNFGRGDLPYMNIISQEEIPNEFNELCKNGKQATFKVVKL